MGLPILRVRLHGAESLDDPHPIRDTSEDGVLAIKVGSGRQGNEVLRTYEEVELVRECKAPTHGTLAACLESPEKCRVRSWPILAPVQCLPLVLGPEFAIARMPAPTNRRLGSISSSLWQPQSILILACGLGRWPLQFLTVDAGSTSACPSRVPTL